MQSLDNLFSCFVPKPSKTFLVLNKIFWKWFSFKECLLKCSLILSGCSGGAPFVCLSVWLILAIFAMIPKCLSIFEKFSNKKVPVNNHITQHSLLLTQFSKSGCSLTDWVSTIVRILFFFNEVSLYHSPNLQANGSWKRYHPSSQWINTRYKTKKLFLLLDLVFLLPAVLIESGKQHFAFSFLFHLLNYWLRLFIKFSKMHYHVSL